MIDDEFDFDESAASAAAPPVSAPSESAKPPQFEELLSRLEAIVGEMESGRLSLEDCLARFEEGAKLSTQCSKRLEETEKKVELLMQRGNQMHSQPFPGTES